MVSIKNMMFNHFLITFLNLIIFTNFRYIFFYYLKEFLDIKIIIFSYFLVFTDGVYSKGTRAHTHRELSREWLWGAEGRSLEYV